jgi:hypothetical protein
MRARVFIAAAVIAMLAAPAWAQDKRMQRYGEKDAEKSATELQAEKEAERAYQRSLGNVPAKGPVDPWGGARSAEAPKGEAKAAAKTDAKAAPRKPKTVVTPN